MSLVSGKPSIAIVGAGNLGSALALALRGAGFRIREIVSREGRASRSRALALGRRVGARAIAGSEGELSADVIWICVPDRAIAEQARRLAEGATRWRGKVVLHSSGALTSAALTALRRKGANVGSAHPMMTFVPGVAPSLRGVGFAIEGDRAAVRVARVIVRGLGGQPFAIAAKHKVAYHAWGTFASPLVIALLAITERVAARAGVAAGQARRRALPILQQTLKNYARRGATGGFSGPIIRGDVETVRKHLRVVRRVAGADEVYRALANAALRTLPVRNRGALQRMLKSGDGGEF